MADEPVLVHPVMVTVMGGPFISFAAVHWALVAMSAVVALPGGACLAARRHSPGKRAQCRGEHEKYEENGEITRHTR